MKNEYDLTEGNITKTVILFSLSFLLANLIQTLYRAVDLMVVGWYCSSEAVAAVPTGMQVAQIVTSFISGLTLRGAVMADEYVGMKQIDDIKKTISTSLCLFTVTGILLAALLLLFQTPVLTLLKTSKATFPWVKQYVSICTADMFFTCGYNTIGAILRGYGDSKSPLPLVAVVGGLNVVGDIFFVKQLHTRAVGATLATILSQALSMAYAMVYLNRWDSIFRFYLSNFKIYGDKMREFALVGIPISLQECMVRLSFFYLTSITNALGVCAASMVGIASKYDVFAMLSVTSVSSVLVSTVAQDCGAEKYHRTNRALFMDIAFTPPFPLAFFLWTQILPAIMIGVFSMDPTIIETGIPFFKTCSFDYLCILLVFSLNGHLNGHRKAVFTMFSCYSSALALRMSLIYLVCHFLPKNLGAIGTVAPAVSGVMAAYTLVCTLRCMRHDKEAV